MRVDGYLCEKCGIYAPRQYREAALKAGSLLPDGWVEITRYDRPGGPRNLHWCSQTCLDNTVPAEIKKKPKRFMWLEEAS